MKLFRAFLMYVNNYYMYTHIWYCKVYAGKLSYDVGKSFKALLHTFYLCLWYAKLVRRTLCFTDNCSFIIYNDTHSDTHNDTHTMTHTQWYTYVHVCIQWGSQRWACGHVPTYILYLPKYLVYPVNRIKKDWYTLKQSNTLLKQSTIGLCSSN